MVPVTRKRVTVFRRKLADGTESLFINYRINGKRIREPLNLYLSKGTTARQKIENSNILAMAEEFARKKSRELEEAELGVSVRMADPTVMFSDYALKEAEGCRNDGTKHARLQLIENIQEFRKYTRLVDINRAFYSEFVEYMNSKDYAANTIITRTNVLKTILHKAKLDGILTFIPDFSGLVPSKVPGKRNFLNIQEIRAMANVDFKKNPKIKDPEMWERVRRPFLFACFTGLRLSDVRELKWSDIENDRIYLSQKKTKEPVQIPLSANAKRFMPQKLDGNDRVFHDFPTCETWHNEKIREWAKMAGVNKYISFHVSRHTFATLTLDNGADLFTVSKLLGHTKITTTQIYAKVLDEGRKKAVDAIPEI